MLEAILLVGGQGTRLRPLTISTPKPMLPVAGYACTEHQIALAKKAGVTRIVLGTSYRAEVLKSTLVMVKMSALNWFMPWKMNRLAQVAQFEMLLRN